MTFFAALNAKDLQTVQAMIDESISELYQYIPVSEFFSALTPVFVNLAQAVSVVLILHLIASVIPLRLSD